MRTTIRARQEARAREQEEQEIADSAEAPMLPSPPTTEIPNEGTSGTRCVTNTNVRTRMHTLRDFFCMQAGWSIDTCEEGLVLGMTREHRRRKTIAVETEIRNGLGRRREYQIPAKNYK